MLTADLDGSSNRNEKPVKEGNREKEREEGRERERVSGGQQRAVEVLRHCELGGKPEGWLHPPNRNGGCGFTRTVPLAGRLLWALVLA